MADRPALGDSVDFKASYRLFVVDEPSGRYTHSLLTGFAFRLAGEPDNLLWAYTTRADTVMGVTFVAVATMFTGTKMAFRAG